VATPTTHTQSHQRASSGKSTISSTTRAIAQATVPTAATSRSSVRSGGGSGRRGRVM